MAAPSGTVDLSKALVLAAPAMGDWLVIAPVALMLGAGALLLMLRKSVRLHGRFALWSLGLLVLIEALLVCRVVTGGPVNMVMGRWLPPYGIAFTADLFGALMALASGIVAFCAAIHALGETDGIERRYGFFPFLLFLMAGVSGAFLTGDIFNLYVWFEVLLISSFGLLVLGSKPRQIDGAMKYAVLNLVATTLFLIAVGYLYGIYGTLNMADIARKTASLPEEAPRFTLAALFILAFAIKSAAFPVNFWLPASYHTPRTTVSALFGGLLTKVGIYALIRVAIMLLPIERDGLAGAIAVMAIATLIVAPLGALAQSDIRRLIGYLVIAGIGNMLAGIAIGTPAAVAGAIFYALHSIVVMTALYLVAGEVARLAGGRWSLTELGGVYGRNAGFAMLSLLLFFAAAGLPPLSGLWPKIVLVKAALNAGDNWLAAAILVSAFLITLALGRVFLLAFWRDRPEPVEGVDGKAEEPDVPVSGGWPVLVPLALLATLTLAFGLLPEALVEATQSAAEGLANPQAYIEAVFGTGAGQ